MSIFISISSFLLSAKTITPMIPSRIAQFYKVYHMKKSVATSLDIILFLDISTKNIDKYTFLII